jgi:hypothetical protein
MGTQSTHFDTLVTASSRAGREERPEEEVTRWGITAKGMEYLERWRAEQARIAEAQTYDAQQDTPDGAPTRPRCANLKNGSPGHPGDTAPLRRSNKPFSLLA